MPQQQTPSPPEVLDVEVFRAGDYGPRGRYGEDDLDVIANDYSPQRHEAPVTLDHRQDGPADGWVARIRRVGDRLVATLTGLSPRLRELLATGAYRKRSVELYRHHRETRRPYLKAVSFLGAAAPEVKGLADPLFMETSPDPITFTEDHEPKTTHDTDSANNFAESMRERLMRSRRWRPSWQESGLLAVFTALGPGDHSEALFTILSEEPPPVALGPAEMIPASECEDNLHCFVGDPSPESLQRHHRALAFLATHPAHTYAEALLHTSA